MITIEEYMNMSMEEINKLLEAGSKKLEQMMNEVHSLGELLDAGDDNGIERFSLMTDKELEEAFSKMTSLELAKYLAVVNEELLDCASGLMVGVNWYKKELYAAWEKLDARQKKSLKDKKRQYDVFKSLMKEIGATDENGVVVYMSSHLLEEAADIIGEGLVFGTDGNLQ